MLVFSYLSVISFLIFFESSLLTATSASPSCNDNYYHSPVSYVVPEPKFQIYRPKGLKVSIPNTEGIQLFAFHGNINKPVGDSETGQLYGDISRPTNGRWIFLDSQIKLKMGDTIHYWLYILKDNLGYRYRGKLHKVEEYTHKHDRETPDTSSTIDIIPVTETPSSSMSNNNDAITRLCEKTVLNLTQTFLTMHKELESMRETNNILRDLVTKDDQMAKTFIFDGRLPKDDNALSIAQEIVRQKLQLNIPLVHAVRNLNGSITSTVSRLDEKIEIIKKAKEKLVNSYISVVY